MCEHEKLKPARHYPEIEATILYERHEQTQSFYVGRLIIKGNNVMKKPSVYLKLGVGSKEISALGFCFQRIAIWK